MKNPLSKFLVFTLLLFSVSKSFSQDFLNINFSGDQSAQVNPKRIITTGGSSYILYDKENNSNPSNPYVGVSKIDRSTNQVLFDLRFDLSNNTSYPYSHTIKGIDIETFNNTVFVLASINDFDILLIQIDKNTGGLIKKEIIPSSSNSLSANFTPLDLFLGSQDYNVYPDTDPYITILGKTSSGSGYNNRLQILYKKMSDSEFKEVTINYPQYISEFKDCKINRFRQNAIKISFVDQSTIHTLDYNIASNTQSNNIYSFDYGYKIQGLTFFNWDGIDFYCGQFTYPNFGNYNGDFFYFRTDAFQYNQAQVNTFNNPNLRIIKGDSHSNEDDISEWGHVNGGANTAYGAAFAGLYYDPSDPTHPRYAVGKLDLMSGESGPDLLKAYSYTLRDNGPSSSNLNNNYSDISSLFGSTTLNTAGNPGIPDLSGIFYRKPLGVSDRGNAYYLPSLTNNTSCSNEIQLTRTTYFGGFRCYAQYYFDNINIYAPQFIGASDFTLNSFNATPGQIYPVCIEVLTNSDPGVICDPVLGCYLEPQNNAIKSNTSNISLENDDNTLDDVRISPNPVKDQILCTAKSTIKQIQIFDNLGKIIMKRENINARQTSLQVSYLKSGSYFVKVFKTNGSTYIKKVIKM